MSGLALIVTTLPAGAQATGSCGDVLLSPTAWLGGNGVAVRSNGAVEGTGSDCAGGSSYVGIVNAGEKWQCVELVNRLYLTRGWIGGTWFGNAGPQFYDDAPSSLIKQANGSVPYLGPGDVVVIDVYFRGTLDGGHVLVVDNASRVAVGSVRLVSQNSGYRSTAEPVVTGTISHGSVSVGGGGGGYSYHTVGVVHAPVSGPSGPSSRSPSPSAPIGSSPGTTPGASQPQAPARGFDSGLPASPPSVAIGWSPAHPGWIVMTLAGFRPGGYTYSCNFTSGGDASFSLTASGGLQTFDNANTCYDLESGDELWVTIGGVRSNTLSVPAAVPAAIAPPVPASASTTSAPATLPETVGGVTHTWTDFSNAGGIEGLPITNGDTVQVACKVGGFQVADGNTWWYRVASTPWSGSYYASADAFYNNGETSGLLRGTPFVDSNVPPC